MALSLKAGESRHCPEHAAQAAKAVPEGSCGQAIRQPASTYRSAVPIPPIKYKQNISILSRSLARHHLARTLSNNLRTLSLVPRESCLRNRFTLAFNLQNQEDYSLVGRQIHLDRDRFFPEPALDLSIKIIRGRSPQLIISSSGYLPHFKNLKTLQEQYI